MLFCRCTWEWNLIESVHLDGYEKTLCQPVFSSHLPVRLDGAAHLRAARLAQQGSATLAWKPKAPSSEQGRHLPDLPFLFLHVPFHIGLADCSLHH